MSSKQVIVMKRFAALRTGKYISQGAHASTGALLSIAKHDIENECLIIPLHNTFIKEWILGRFTKITVYVRTDEELLKIHQAALDAGLPCALIQDSGITEFKGIPTYTCVGIGPGDTALIDTITSTLPLF